MAIYTGVFSVVNSHAYTDNKCTYMHAHADTRALLYNECCSSNICNHISLNGFTGFDVDSVSHIDNVIYI